MTRFAWCRHASGLSGDDHLGFHKRKALELDPSGLENLRQGREIFHFHSATLFTFQEDGDEQTEEGCSVSDRSEQRQLHLVTGKAQEDSIQAFDTWCLTMRRLHHMHTCACPCTCAQLVLVRRALSYNDAHNTARCCDRTQTITEQWYRCWFWSWTRLPFAVHAEGDLFCVILTFNAATGHA